MSTTDPASAAGPAAVEAATDGEAASLRLRQLATLLGLVSGVQAVTLFAVLALPTLATKAAPVFGVGAEAVGYQISLIYIVASLVSSFAGLYVRRYGAATTSFVAVAIAAIALAGFASGDLVIAALCSIACGVAYGVTNPAASHLLWRFAPSGRRNLIFAIKQTGTPLGGMLASLLLPALSVWLGWQGAMMASLGLFIAIALPLWLKRSAWDDDRDPGARIRGSLFNGVQVALGHATLRGLAIVGLSYACYQFCLFSFIVTMLVVDFEWSLISAGWMATATQIGGISGRIGWSMLADRIGRGIQLLAVIGLLATALGVLVATMTTAWPAYAMTLVLFLFGFCLVGWNGLFMAEAARAAGPANVGVATGGVLVFTFAGIVIGPAAFATVYKLAGSYALTYGLFALAPLIGVAALIPVLRRR